MSGSIIGGIVGAVIGWFVNGPTGAYYGWMIGSMAGAVLMPPELEGPRLSDLRPQGSEYGRPIPIVYGTVALAGNVIWQTDLVEVASDGGGKGGPEVTEYSYYANFAVLICEGEAELGRIWAGPEKRLIWDGTTLEGGSFTYYSGSSTQLPDPLMEAHEGVGNVPAYRGYSYIVFENFPVKNDGNRIPILTIEVGRVTTTPATIGWTVDYYVNETAGTYIVPHYWGSTVGVTVRNLADNSFVANWPNNDPYLHIFAFKHFFIDEDRNRLVESNNQTAMWMDLETGEVTAVPGLSIYGPVAEGAASDAGYNFIAGMYHGGLYVYLTSPKAAVSGGVGRASVTAIDPDSETALWTYTGDGPSTELIGPIYHIEDSDDFIIAYDTIGQCFVKVPFEDDFTSIPWGTVAPVNLTDGMGSRQDPNTGYIWTWNEVGTGSDVTVTYSVNDITTGTQLYTGTLHYDNWMLGGGGDFAFVPGTPNRAIYCLSKQVGYGHDYLTALDADTTFDLIVEGPYGQWSWIAGYGIKPGFWNPVLGSYWFGRDRSGMIARSMSNLMAYDDVPLNEDSELAGVPVGPNYAIFIGDRGLFVEGELLSDVMSDLCTRAGLTGSDIDVSQLEDDTVDGYAIAQRTSVRGAIQTLQPAFFFDVVESGGLVKFVKRGQASVVAIPDEDLGAHQSGSDSEEDLMTIRRQMEDELPRAMTVKYISRASKYDANTKMASRLVGASGEEQTLDLPIVMRDAVAQGVAQVNLHKSWVGRKTFSFCLPMKYAYLEPTDVITIHNDQTLMLTKISQHDGYFKCEGVFDDYNYTPNVVVTESTINSGSVFVPTETYAILMNLEALRDQDTDPGFYASARGVSATGWRGAALYQSKDAGANYTVVGTFTGAAVIGTTTDVLADYTGGDAIDTVSSVNVRLVGGTLSSVSEDSFLAGANVAAIGTEPDKRELVYFRYATLEVDGTYTLTRFLRGRRGSSYANSTHTAEDDFVLLSSSTTIRIDGQPSDIGQEYLYKAVSVGMTLADATAFTFTNTGASYAPSAPIDVSQPATLYGRDPTTTTGLTWGYYGGAKLKSDGTIVLITAGTVALTDNATNYIYAQDNGTVVVTTSMPTGWPAPLASNATALYEVVTAGGVVTSYIDYRTAGGGGGGGGGGGFSSPLTTKGDIHVYATDDDRLGVGADGEVLTADSSEPTGLKWAAPTGSASPLTTKGDLFTHDTVDNRLPVGADGKVLTADSSQATGLKWASQPFDVQAFYPGLPASNAKVLRIPVARAVTFPANFTGSYGRASIAATGSSVFDVQKNGSSIGTITFAAASMTATFATTSGAAQSLAAGDVLSIIAPASPDATLGDVGFVLAGTR